MEKVTGNIENLEIEAEKSLDSARERANAIITEANRESQQIISAPLDLDDVKNECSEMIKKARQEAEEKVKESASQAKILKSNAEKKVDDIISRLTEMVTGA